ncbi:acyl CoA:acetate/3-ketoacid CoA transferase subunit beta [Priestia aryabhattai]|uniref:3-oxoacid CoA-transferase subunit B n=1 Tax=Priestia TaxID=2800373 RepID=UPI000B9FDC82|nr:3-oxoacid CoA-transferase subunit B [Priestia flexa]MDT2045991.1 3-oxoacid CoA-transferase subunit B [Priestia flexa]OZT10793.1 acyl CoA:acetate/3-ketoacid CoA transferase subunit beta [Priestia aryabhattai]USY53974.1 3-oxoacid CoA-transferase subunit B [Bacillus sp. 1780r2a1]
MGLGIDSRQRIAKRAAQEIENGMIVNLGIGIPSLIPNYIPSTIAVMFHAENGIVGIGPSPVKGQEDENACNAAGYPITTLAGSSYCDSAIAFGMIRKGYVDMTILGALEVSEQGDLANWIVPGKRVPGMGGAMELAQKVKKVVVLMNHTNKNGEPKLVKSCSLPLTAKRCVDLIITDQAVLKVENNRLILIEVMSPYTVEEVLQATDATVELSDSIKMIP